MFQSVVIIINTKIIQPTGGTATMLQWIILASDFTTIIYLFIYLTLPINIKTQKNTYMDNGREHATAYANYSGPYISDTTSQTH